jgi:hypothetical protein
MNEKTVPEIARDALDLLDRDGWCKWAATMHEQGIGCRQYRKGAHCLGGALSMAYGATADMWTCPQAVYQRVADLIGEQYPEWQEWKAGFPVVCTITAFNDHEDTTEADVRRILEKLAAG